MSVTVLGPEIDRGEEILTPQLLDFVAGWTSSRRPRRSAPGNGPVAPAPADLLDRRVRVEITGPPEPKMAINAVNSGARV